MDSQRRGRGGRGRHGHRGGEDRDVRLSKALSFALRHGAAQMGLDMSSDGFLFVDNLLTHPQFRSYSLEDVERVVANCDKQRFKLRTLPEDGRVQIRANQGHTVQVPQLELRAIKFDDPDCPRDAVHGTYLQHWPSIRSQGLKRMKRTHIHLAPGLPGDGGVISGMRVSCDIAIFIDVHKALADGIQFYWSENRVVLTPGDSDGILASKYFTCVLQLKPTRCELPLA